MLMCKEAFARIWLFINKHSEEMIVYKEADGEQDLFIMKLLVNKVCL